MDSDTTNPPVLDSSTLVLAFIEALITKLNKAIDYDRISTAVSNQVERLIKPLTDKLAEKDAEIDQLTSKCQALEERCDDLEQYSRKDSIRIFGLPEIPDENPYDSVTWLCNTQMKLKPPLTLGEISNCHRIGPMSSHATKPRPMIVRFTTNRSKQCVMANRKKLKGVDGNDILGPRPGDPTPAEMNADDEHEKQTPATDLTTEIMPVYINDDLCKARAILAFRARQLKNDKKINDTRVNRGMIIIKDKVNKIHSLSALSQLEQFK